MGIDYCAYAFYGLKIGEGYGFGEEEVEAKFAELGHEKTKRFGYLMLGNMMGDSELPTFLILGETLVGGNFRYIDGSVTKLKDADVDWARNALYEVVEACGWEWEEPAWYMGTSIS